MALAGFYALGSAACAAIALLGHDLKGRFVLLQLPVALQAAVIPESILRVLEHASWQMAYVLLGFPTVMALYFFGAWLGKFVTDRR